ncbi:hypothetical protein [Pseudoalteromonas luteoviolacea]|nr:hypothetical protein [Pseudoalteromonas luteoviolacea]
MHRFITLQVWPQLMEVELIEPKLALHFSEKYVNAGRCVDARGEVS